MPTLPLTHVHLHIQHLVLHKSPFKIATRKTQISLNSIVTVLCSVLITEWISWESSVASSTRAAGPGLGLFK
jgi:hypothetical protein